jgi:hypothetical protein
MVLEAPEVRMLLHGFWPELVSSEILATYARGERRIDDVSGGSISAEEADLLHSAWRDSDGWTVEDVALLDELDAILGDAHPSPPRAEDDGPRPPDVEDRWYADFAHVVVDEAQDLSPMQWRAVVRRGPYASWTVVGDLAQRARDTPPRSWKEVSELIGRRTVVVEELLTNYRTPSELAPLARRSLALAGHDPDGFPRTVRSNGNEPRLIASDDPLGAGLIRAVHDILEDAAAPGTIGVVVPTAHLAVVGDMLASSDLPEDADVRVLDARSVKGLEFDDLVVVAPEAILRATPLGAHDLYVALTRATRSLTITTSEPWLPVLEGVAQV